MQLAQLTRNIVLVFQVSHTKPNCIGVQHLDSEVIGVHELVDLHRKDAFLLERVTVFRLEERDQIPLRYTEEPGRQAPDARHGWCHPGKA